MCLCVCAPLFVLQGGKFHLTTDIPDVVSCEELNVFRYCEIYIYIYIYIVYIIIHRATITHDMSCANNGMVSPGMQFYSLSYMMV